MDANYWHRSFFDPSMDDNDKSTYSNISRSNFQVNLIDKSTHNKRSYIRSDLCIILTEESAYSTVP